MPIDEFLRFPRLRVADALRLAERLLQDPAAIAPSTSHPNQIYAPIGGPTVEATHLDAVRSSVLEAVEDARDRHDRAMVGEGISWQTRFDIHVGKALHQSLRICRSEAAVAGVWSWLTLVLLPDIVPHRYPSTKSTARVTGGLRNIFSVTWWPVEVLGDLVEPESGRGLQVDEIVGLFERPTLSRDGELAAAYAATIRTRAPAGRMFATREFAKAVRRIGAHTSWELGDRHRLTELWDEACRRADTSPRPESAVTEGKGPDPIGLSVRLGALDLPIEMERADRELQPTGHLTWTSVRSPATAGPPDAVIVEGQRIELVPDGVSRSGGHPRYKGTGRLVNGVNVQTTVIHRSSDIYIDCKLS